MAIQTGMSPSGGARLKADFDRPLTKGALVLLHGKPVGTVLADCFDVNDAEALAVLTNTGARFELDSTGSIIMTPHTAADRADADDIARTDAQRAWEARLHGLWKR